MKSDERLEDLVRPVVEALNLQLWGVEYSSQGRCTVVRIFIDNTEGVKLLDCESVSRQVGSLFDVEDPIAGEYQLEVSSPGLDRPLFSEDQYSKFVGHEVKVTLRRPFEGRRKFKGLLRAVADGEISIVLDEHEYILPLESVEKANIVPHFD